MYEAFIGLWEEAANHSNGPSSFLFYALFYFGTNMRLEIIFQFCINILLVYTCDNQVLGLFYRMNNISVGLSLLFYFPHSFIVVRFEADLTQLDWTSAIRSISGSWKMKLINPIMKIHDKWRLWTHLWRLEELFNDSTCENVVYKLDFLINDLSYQHKNDVTSLLDFTRVKMIHVLRSKVYKKLWIP